MTPSTPPLLKLTHFTQPYPPSPHHHGAAHAAVLINISTKHQGLPAVMSPPGTVILFSPGQHTHLIPYLAAIHAACITHDHAVATFLPPLSHEKLLAWWKDRIAEVAAGSRLIFVLLRDDSPDMIPGAGPKGPEVVGVVMLAMPSSETSPFRAEVEKLLVHGSWRGRGGARRLMEVLEREALHRGKTTLVSLSPLMTA